MHRVELIKQLSLYVSVRSSVCTSIIIINFIHSLIDVLLFRVTVPSDICDCLLCCRIHSTPYNKTFIVVTVALNNTYSTLWLRFCICFRKTLVNFKWSESLYIYSDAAQNYVSYNQIDIHLFIANAILYSIDINM